MILVAPPALVLGAWFAAPARVRVAATVVTAGVALLVTALGWAVRSRLDARRARRARAAPHRTHGRALWLVHPRRTAAAEAQGDLAADRDRLYSHS